MSKTAEQIEVEQAYERGAKIEYKNHLAPEWIDLDWPFFDWRYGDYRVKAAEEKPAPAPEPPPETEDFIPWSAINERFTHSARTPDGLIFVFTSRPEIVTGGFRTSSLAMRIDHILTAKAGSKPWPKSIQERRAGSILDEEEPARLKVMFNSGKVTFAPTESPTVADCIDTGLLIELNAKTEAHTTPVEAVKPLILSGCGRQPNRSPDVQRHWEISPETRRGMIFQ